MDDFANMTGENNLGAPRGLVLDELKLVGRSMENAGGYFKLAHLTQPKIKDNDGKERYPVTELREAVTLVPFCVRRRLVESDADGMVRWTPEHDTTEDLVQLFSKDEKERTKAPASMLRQQYERLRTEQVVYCRYKGQIIRLRVKGLSLRPGEKEELHTSFYEYFSSFRQPDRFWQFALKLVPTEVLAKAGKNWAIDFQRGERLTDEQIEKVKENIKEVYDANKAVSDHYNKPAAPEAAVEDAIEEYNTATPNDEINPDDIPF